MQVLTQTSSQPETLISGSSAGEHGFVCDSADILSRDAEMLGPALRLTTG